MWTDDGWVNPINPETGAAMLPTDLSGEGSFAAPRPNAQGLVIGPDGWVYDETDTGFTKPLWHSSQISRSGFSNVVGAALTPGINTATGRTYLDPLRESVAEAQGDTNFSGGPSLSNQQAAQLGIAATLIGGGGAAAGLWGGGGTAAGGVAGAELGGAQLAELSAGAGLGNTAPAASGFMTPAGAGLGAETAGFAGSVGSPVATGAGALPAWAEGAGVAGATTGAASAGSSGGTGGGGSAAPAGSALSRIIDGTASNADWLSVLGTAGATGLGMYSANQQSNSLERLAEQTRAERAPFLNQATGWLNNPDSYWQGPGQASLDANLRRLSASHGNPISSPTALGIASQAGMQDWRNAWSTAGNLGLGGQDIRAQLGTGAAGADANVWSTLAGGVGDIVNPRKSLSDMMREYATVIGGMRT